MKLYLHFEGTPDFTYKLTTDSQIQTIQHLHQNFIKAYNEKFGTQRVLREETTEVVTSSRKSLQSSDMVSKIEDGADLYIVEKVGGKRQCTRNGCGKSYTELENVDNCCCFHPGVAVFHEGLKGWSCCSKKVINFDDFMQIPGCAVGKHTDVDTRPKDTPRPSPAMDVKLVGSDQTGEKYKTAEQPLTKGYTHQPIDKKTITPEKKGQDPLEEDDPMGVPINSGAPCLHRGCNYKYEDETSKVKECVYHTGVPIFHEGSKGWSCCKKKVLEFEEFMRIEGCKTGRHRFVPPPKKQEEQAQCRYEWYQMPSNVFVTIYAKDVAKEESKVEFSPRTVTVDIKFKDGRRFSKVFKLTEAVVPEQCTATFLSVKVEINLRKASGMNWSNLESNN